MVVICAWCPDKAERDAEAARRGFAVSHGICDACKRTHFATLVEVTPENFQSSSVSFVCRPPAGTLRSPIGAQ